MSSNENLWLDEDEEDCFFVCVVLETEKSVSFPNFRSYKTYVFGQIGPIDSLGIFFLSNDGLDIRRFGCWYDVIHAWSREIVMTFSFCNTNKSASEFFLKVFDFAGCGVSFDAVNERVLCVRFR